MARSMWEVFRSLFERKTADGDDDERGTLLSPLDQSVRSSHGGADEEVDRELRTLRERARDLEEARRDS